MRRPFKRAYNLVGHDASGLELRVLAHYINDEKFTKEVSEGDPHTANQLAAGLPTRDAAKTFIYAFIYGAGNKKIGSIVGGGTAQGRAIKERFLAANPKLGALIEGVQRAASKGWVKGIDGRRVRIRKDPDTGRPQVHKALNTLIQTGGALVMKYSMVWLDLAKNAEGLDATKVIDMHDEGQNETLAEHTQRYRWLAEESIRVAGRYLGMRCPLDAESKVGKRWSETH
jgi:DNA polymerase I-like protein with 3'-5' exonuclease and polymerase domains